jgi:D-sedoheptulose 7-phosphate isomerase
MIEDIQKEISQHNEVHNNFFAEDNNTLMIQHAAWAMIKSIQSGGKIISIGNGGSMSDAMHFASELSGRFRKSRPAIAALALSDIGAMTCIANDFGYNQVFKRQIEAVGKDNDVLLCLSTSGNSENILVAAEHCQRKGIKVISICGKHGKLRQYSDLVIEIPHEGDASRTQELSILIIHILVMLIEKKIFESNP